MIHIIENNTLRRKVFRKPDIKNLETSRPMTYHHKIEAARARDYALDQKEFLTSKRPI